MLVATLTLNYWGMQPKFNLSMKWIYQRFWAIVCPTKTKRTSQLLWQADIYPKYPFFWILSSLNAHKTPFCWTTLFFKVKLLRLKTWKFVMTQQKHFMWNKVPHKFKTLKTLRVDLLRYKRQNSFSILFQYDYSFEDKINLLAWEVARLWLCVEERREKRELNYSQTKPVVSRHKIDSKQNHQCSWWRQSHK